MDTGRLRVDVMAFGSDCACANSDDTRGGHVGSALTTGRFVYLDNRDQHEGSCRGFTLHPDWPGHGSHTHD